MFKGLPNWQEVFFDGKATVGISTAKETYFVPITAENLAEIGKMFTMQAAHMEHEAHMANLMKDHTAA